MILKINCNACSRMAKKSKTEAAAPAAAAASPKVASPKAESPKKAAPKKEAKPKAEKKAAAPKKAKTAVSNAVNITIFCEIYSSNIHRRGMRTVTANLAARRRSQAKSRRTPRILTMMVIFFWNINKFHIDIIITFVISIIIIVPNRLSASFRVSGKVTRSEARAMAKAAKNLKWAIQLHADHLTQKTWWLHIQAFSCVSHQLQENILPLHICSFCLYADCKFILKFIKKNIGRNTFEFEKKYN